MEYKFLPFEIKSVEDRVVTSLYSVMGRIDSVGDRITNGAFLKTIQERGDRVRALWQHDFDSPPVAVPLSLREIDREDLSQDFLLRYPDATGGLLGQVKYLDTPRGNEIFAGIVAGAIRENSIGFDVIKSDSSEENVGGVFSRVRNIRECRLWDISAVNWGAQEAALVVVKSAVPFSDTGINEDVEAEWVAPQLSDFTDKEWVELSEQEKKRISQHFAIIKDGNLDNFENLLFPHHVPSKEGVGKVVWKGLLNATNELTEYKSVTEQQLSEAYNHLSQHYAKFSQEAPDFKFVQFVKYSLILPELKVGRILSEKNYSAIKNAVDVLNEVLRSAEPQCEDEDEPETEVEDEVEVKGTESNNAKALTASQRLKLELLLREKLLEV